MVSAPSGVLGCLIRCHPQRGRLAARRMVAGGRGWGRGMLGDGQGPPAGAVSEPAAGCFLYEVSGLITQAECDPRCS